MDMKIKVDFFFGDIDWMSKDGAARLEKDFKNIDVHVIESAGHQMIFDNPLDVTKTICKCYVI